MSETKAIYRVSEHDEQAAFVADVLYRYSSRPDFARPLFFAPMNGAWIGGTGRGGKYALMAKYKAAGMTPGVADILYLQPRGGHPYMAIEMKTPNRRNENNGGLSAEQTEFLQAARACNAFAWVCYGAQEAIEKFDKYMSMEVTA
jgi:hypothetical protein